jgi:hypothetical protein
MRGFVKSELNTAMKLFEAKYQGDEKIVVIIRDLPYAEIFDRKVEEPGPPLIDSRTGVLVLSIDLLDYSRFAETGAMPYSEAKHHYPWQIEMAGTEKQIRHFIHTYFPTWSTDGELEQSAMWDEPHLARAAAAAERTGAIIEGDANDQVSKILEAKYAKEYTAFEAFERYESLVKTKKVWDNIILDDHEYGEGNDKCYAQLFGWVMEPDYDKAHTDAVYFSKEIDVPYTQISVDRATRAFGDQGFHVTWLYVQECPGIDDHYYEPMFEARYYRHLSASEVYDRMDDILDYTKHAEVDTDVVGIIDFGLGSVNHSIEDAPEVAYVEMLVKTTDKERAKQLAGEFLDSKDVPYEYMETEYANDEEVYVRAQWVDPITEAQLQDKPKVSFARLKRVARKVQELTGAKIDKYDSKEDLLILDVWKTLYISDVDRLDDAFGPHDEFDIPEFKLPWHRWEIDGVWIIMKDYSGNLQFEVLPASTREQPQDRYLRQRHDAIMDPAAYESVMEAKYYKEDDKYVCPDCEGEGGFYIQDGPDDYDVERCEMCVGRGWLKHRDVQHLLQYNDLYKPEEFKRITEARTVPPRQFTNNDLYQVAGMYKKHEKLRETGEDPFIQTTPQMFGDRIVPRLEIWYRQNRWSAEDAEQDALDFMKFNRLPYTQVRFRSTHYGAVDYYISKFRFGHPRDDDKLAG